MNNIQNTFTGKLKKLYKKAGYLDKYGGSVIITGLILLCFWLIFSYFVIKAKILPIRADWVNQRCNPQVMPFAGIINPPKDQSKFSFTASNFSNCIGKILKEMMGDVMKPVYYAEHGVIDMFNELKKGLDEVRKVFADVRSNITDIVQQILNRVLNMLVPVVHIFVKLKDILLKTAGTLTATLLNSLGVYMILQSFVGTFLELLVAGLEALVAAIVISWIMPWTWPVAITMTAIFAAVAIPTSIMTYWFGQIYDNTYKSAPSSSCFDENTKIDTMTGPKCIKNINTGEILSDGTRVTATFKLSSKGEQMYKYHNIVVSGSHQIMTPCGKCISVFEHPHSRRITGYHKPYLYCLSTTSKIININGIIFSDWDEVDNMDWANIQRRAKEYLPIDVHKEHFHKYLENGLGALTPIELLNGEERFIKNIKIGDILSNKTRVLGIVEVDTLNLDAVKKINIKGNAIICGPNVPFFDRNLGNVSTLRMGGSKISSAEKLYHLITDTGSFNVRGTKFYDYNGVIEKMIEGPDILFPSF